MQPLYTRWVQSVCYQETLSWGDGDENIFRWDWEPFYAEIRVGNPQSVHLTSLIGSVAQSISAIFCNSRDNNTLGTRARGAFSKVLISSTLTSRPFPAFCAHLRKHQITLTRSFSLDEQLITVEPWTTSFQTHAV